MNLSEFNEKYKVSQHTNVEITCDICGSEKTLSRWRAESNVKRNGMYVCASCAMKKHHAQNPVKAETKEKQRLGRLGKKHTIDAKDKIREAKNKLYKTPQGDAQRRPRRGLARTFLAVSLSDKIRVRG